MKRFSEQLHKKSQTVKLKKSEQADLRERIVSYMEYHPLPPEMKVAAAPAKKATAPILTEAFAQFAIPYQMLFKLGGAAAVFILVIIPFMAERTVPGDTLYAVKVQFNEEVRSTLTWGSYEKVEWETARLNRRIAEARLLADEGLLTEAVEAEVAAAVKVHSDNAKREIEVLRASDADEATIATIAFDSSLQVQAQALQEQSAAAGTTTRTGELISNALDDSLEESEQADVAAVPAYGKLMARVELNTTRVRELRDSLAGNISDTDLADVTRRIEDIDRAVGDAIKLAENPATELVAREALVGVITRTQKLIVFMTDLQVREQVAIESVVPVVLTTDEMKVDETKRLRELQTAVATIDAAMLTIADEQLVGKLADSQEKLTTALDQLTSSESYESFVSVSTVALALAADALQLIENQDIDLLEIIELPTDVASTSTATTTDEIVSVNATSSTAVVDENSTPVVSSDATSTDATTTSAVAENTQTEIDTQN